jgi:hypothetical protein
MTETQVTHLHQARASTTRIKKESRMTKFGNGVVFAGATTLSFAGGVVADDGELARQIADLKRANEALAAKVERLEASSNGDEWLTEQRADEIRGIVTDVLADADSRTSLQSAGATAGWNKDQGGFFIASPNGDFKLNIKGQIQFRWAYDHRSNDGITTTNQPGTGSQSIPKENVWGFENRRTKLAFTGFVIDPSWTYEIQPIFNRSPGTVTSGDQTFSSGNIVGSVENVWIQKTFDNGFNVRVGQFKSPFMREELVSSSSQLAVERTLVSEMFTTKFSQGIQFEYGGRTGDPLKAQFFYGDGLRANGTNVPTNTATSWASAATGFSGGYTTPFNSNLTNWAFAGRLEWLGAGTWKQFRDLNSFRGEEFGWMAGVGGMGQSIRPQNEGEVSDKTTKSMWGVTADLTMDFGGSNLFMYGVYRRVNLTGDVTTRDGEADGMNQWGAVVQGGVFISNDVELYARYEIGDTDTDQFRTVEPGVELELDSIVTAGFNYYIDGNKDVKWTTDFGYAFTPIGDFATSGADWLQDFSGSTGDGFTNDGQWVFRTQLQLLF